MDWCSGSTGVENSKPEPKQGAYIKVSDHNKHYSTASPQWELIEGDAGHEREMERKINRKTGREEGEEEEEGGGQKRHSEREVLTALPVSPIGPTAPSAPVSPWKFPQKLFFTAYCFCLWSWLFSSMQ